MKLKNTENNNEIQYVVNVIASLTTYGSNLWSYSSVRLFVQKPTICYCLQAARGFLSQPEFTQQRERETYTVSVNQSGVGVFIVYAYQLCRVLYAAGILCSARDVCVRSCMSCSLAIVCMIYIMQITRIHDNNRKTKSHQNKRSKKASRDLRNYRFGVIMLTLNGEYSDSLYSMHSTHTETRDTRVSVCFCCHSCSHCLRRFVIVP